jgi:hypothetical protein
VNRSTISCVSTCSIHGGARRDRHRRLTVFSNTGMRGESATLRMTMAAVGQVIANPLLWRCLRAGGGSSAQFPFELISVLPCDKQEVQHPAVDGLHVCAGPRLRSRQHHGRPPGPRKPHCQGMKTACPDRRSVNGVPDLTAVLSPIWLRGPSRSPIPEAPARSWHCGLSRHPTNGGSDGRARF